jgi:16S rRNA (guanine527-N7)-methyltransferase
LAADLGSGGGVPGLALALAWRESRWLLIESGRRRAGFLREAVVTLGLAPRVVVMEQRAEEVGRDPQCRGRCGLVVARGFGPPAVTAECAAPLLETGGRAVVSEPPGGDAARWPPGGLAVLAMAPGPVVDACGATFQVLVQTRPCPDRFPRRTGVPAKRPLF